MALAENLPHLFFLLSSQSCGVVVPLCKYLISSALKKALPAFSTTPWHAGSGGEEQIQ